MLTATDVATIRLDEIRGYENSLKDYRDYNNVIDSARKRSKEDGVHKDRKASKVYDKKS